MVAQEMTHFVSNLQQYLADRLIVAAWAQLERVRLLPDVCVHIVG